VWNGSGVDCALEGVGVGVPDGLEDEREGGSSCRGSNTLPSSHAAVDAVRLASRLPLPVVDGDDDARGEEVADKVGVGVVDKGVADVLDPEGGISAGQRLHSKRPASQ
jgi:hypothetical protein